MTGPEPTTCSHCGSGFECGAETGHCWCAQLDVDQAEAARLAANGDGCLCPRCLPGKPAISGHAVPDGNDTTPL